MSLRSPEPIPDRVDGAEDEASAASRDPWAWLTWDRVMAAVVIVAMLLIVALVARLSN